MLSDTTPSLASPPLHSGRRTCPALRTLQSPPNRHGICSAIMKCTCSLITLPIGRASQSTCSGSCALAGGLRRSTSYTAASSCFCHGAVLTVADACHSPVSLLGRLICAFDAHALVPKPATLPRQHRCSHQHYRPLHQLQFFRTKRQTLPSTRIPLI
jgi:hypothetical protein